MIAGTRGLGLLIVLLGLCCGAPIASAQSPDNVGRSPAGGTPAPSESGQAPGEQKAEPPPKKIDWPSAKVKPAEQPYGTPPATPADAPSPGSSQGQPAQPQAQQPQQPRAQPQQPQSPAPAQQPQAQPQGQPLPQTAPPAPPAAGAEAPANPSPAPGAGPPGDQPAKAPEAKTEPPKPPPLPAELEKALNQSKGLASELSAMVKTVERVKTRDKELIEQLTAVENLIAAAQTQAEQLQPKLETVRSLISRLGPAPDGKDVPAESAAIAERRARLNSVAAEIDGAIKEAALVETQARLLSGRIQEYRQEIFTQDLLRRSRSPLTPAFWQEIGSAAPGAALQVEAIATGWWSSVLSRLPLTIAVTVLSLALYLVLKLGTRRILRALRASQVADPTLFLKVSLAGAQGPLRALPAVAAAGALYAGLYSLNLLYLQVGQLATRALEAFIIYKVTSSLTKAYLQPSRSAWRVLEVDDTTALRLTRLIKVTAAVLALEHIVLEVNRLLYLPLPVSIVTTLTAGLALAILFATIARTPFSLTVAQESPVARLRAELFKVPLLVAAVAIALALGSGYIALAHYIGVHVLSVSAAILLLGMFYLANRAIAAEPDQNPGAQAAAAEPHGLSIDLRRRIAGITAIVLDTVLVVIAVPIVLMSLGYSTADLLTLANRFFFGFEVGGVQISLARISIAFGIFAALLLLTRMLRRWLSETVLHPKRIEQGLGNSISMGVNYLGVGIAALAGISYAGFDITNVALVAGALSVGIGFGLQSIVNNFVSGLILLVERPIKVGDWINVAGQAGHVRRISVRSTEIETFDRASVIIPNSELIAGTVVNLTHRNALGRVTIPVSVDYKCDPEQVMATLLEVAENCPLVAKHPAPFVVFDNFGADGLEFSLLAFVIDVNRSGATKNELRIAIFKRFAADGFSFPHPQRDLHLRDLDGVKTLLAKLVEQRSRPAVKGDGEDEAPAV